MEVPSVAGVRAESIAGEAPSAWNEQSRARHLGRCNPHVYPGWEASSRRRRLLPRLTKRERHSREPEQI